MRFGLFREPIIDAYVKYRKCNLTHQQAKHETCSMCRKIGFPYGAVNNLLDNTHFVNYVGGKNVPIVR